MTTTKDMALADEIHDVVCKVREHNGWTRVLDQTESIALVTALVEKALRRASSPAVVEREMLNAVLRAVSLVVARRDDMGQVHYEELRAAILALSRPAATSENE